MFMFRAYVNDLGSCSGLCFGFMFMHEGLGFITWGVSWQAPARPKLLHVLLPSEREGASLRGVGKG